MKRSILALAVICVATACSSQRNANEELREKLRNHGVGRVEVFQIPNDVFISVIVTPESITKRYHAKLELGGSSLLAEVDALDRALANTECKPSTQEVNVRTAIVFYNGDTKLKGFYYDMDGRNGQVDATTCELGDGLLDWARKPLPQDP